MQNIYKDLQKGVFFIFISKYSNVIVQILITSVLARLISPEDFGIIAISMIFILFFNQLSEIGFGIAIVQKKNLTTLETDTFFLLSIFQGILLCLLFVVLIPFISSFYEIILLKNVLLLLSISIFFFSINTVPYAINRKNKKFKEIGFTTVISNIITGTIAIVIALNTEEKIYALILKVILDSIIIFIINFRVSKIRPRFKFSIKAVKEVFYYSLFQFLYNFTHYFSRNVDNLIIGKYLGAVSLGYYDKAYKLMIMPVQNLSNVISPVLHPVLSTFQDDKNNVIKVYLNLVKFLSLIGFPLSVYLYFTSYEIINLVFGPNWQASVIPFKYLALSVGFQMLILSSKAIFQTLGNTKALFVSSLISTSLLLILFAYGMYSSYNLNELSILVLISYICSFFITFLILFKYVFKDSIYTFLKVHKNPIFISLCLAIAMRYLILEFDNLLIDFFFKTMLFGSIYFLISFFIGEKFLYSNFKKMLKSSKNK